MSERQDRKMQGIWVSVKESISCRNSVSDVVCQPRQLTKQLSEGHIDHSIVMANTTSCKKVAPLSIFTEVGAGDLSRKIIEKILGDALSGSTSKIAKISKIFRVKNSDEVVDRFEKFRDMVKEKAKTRDEKHTRTLVDGNELLCFYVTSTSCLSRETRPVAAPCGHYDCSLCRTIGSRFDRQHTKRSAMQLSVNSEALRERISAVSTGKNTKRAVVICRIIAGRMKNRNDRTSEDEHDSIVKKGFHPNSRHLIVNNPNAVLNCFVVILN